MDDTRREVLRAIADTVVPGLERSPDPDGFWARRGSELAAHEATAQAIEQLPALQRDGLEQLLDGLAQMGFLSASRRSREQLLRNLATLGPQAVAGGLGLVQLTLFFAYGVPDPQTGTNPFWATFGYPGPGPAAEEPGERAIAPLVPAGDEAAYEADAVIVGSGAGGGLIAASLAEAGLKVLVLEAGGYFDEADFNQYELWAYQNLYWRGGPVPTADMNVSVYAGATFGGGTTINWTNCLRTKPWVREQWATEFGLEGVDGPDFDRHLDAVWERLSVNDSCSDLNGTQTRMREGAEALGWAFRATNRNIDASRYTPDSAGFIGFGDRTGAKQSTVKTYLADAVARRRGGDGAHAGRARAHRGRTRGRCGGRLRRSDQRAGRPGDRAGALGGRGRRCAGVAGAPAAVGHRRPRRRAQPAAASLHRGFGQLRRGHARLVGRSPRRPRGRVRQHRGRSWLPDRGHPVRHRHGGVGSSLRGRRGPQGGHEPVPVRRHLHRARARPRSAVRS